jgi:thioredoxin-dependent peroxiredoxin
LIDHGKEATMRRSVIAGVLLGFLVLLAPGALRALEVGQPAPDFTLNNPDGKPVKLGELTGRGPVVIYTFVAAFTPT